MPNDPAHLATTPPEKSATEHAAFDAIARSRAEERAVEMALILMQWQSLEGVLSNQRCGFRERFRAGSALSDLFDRAKRLTDEIVAVHG